VSKLLKELGVDALDCSSGGGTMSAKVSKLKYAVTKIKNSVMKN